jgi:transcription-repair coupling factor (superfamily II helicase)
VPAPAQALLEVARMRAECVRTGVREVTVTKGSAGGFGGPKWMARISPVALPASKVIRVARLYKGAVYKEEVGQLQLPIRVAADAATTVITALQDLIPPPE